MNCENESPQQGPESIAGPLKSYDFTKFDELMRNLAKWREIDHEDALILARTHVVELVEGVKQLRGVF